MRIVAMAAALLAAACASAPRESFYTLAGPPSPPAAAATSATSGLAVLVGPVSVPEEVDRTPMVMRTGPNRVEIDEQHRWAEPLKAGIGRVVAESLSRELGTPRVHAGRGGASFPVDVRVAIEVRRFDSSLAEGSAIDALWTVTGPKGAVRSGRSVVTERSSSADPDGVAAAHGRALARMGSEIAQAIRSIANGG